MKGFVIEAVGNIPAGTEVMLVTLPKDGIVNVIYKGVVQEMPEANFKLIEREFTEPVVEQEKGRTTRENVIQEIFGDKEEVDYALFMQAAQGYLNLRRGEKGWKRKLRKMGYQVADGKIRKKPAATSL